jgi:hypothetical protein
MFLVSLLAMMIVFNALWLFTAMDIVHVSAHALCAALFAAMGYGWLAGC